MNADTAMYLKAAGFISAGLTIAIGCIAPAYGQGLIATKAVESIGKYPESAGKIRNAMAMGLGVVESCAVYPLIISLFILVMSRG